jgi:membrane-bound lytic murein transglycosylase D
MFFGLLSTPAPGSDVDSAGNDFPSYDEEVVISRIKNLKNDVVPPKYNAVVKSYILTYTERKREAAQRILGRSVMYFPLFEEYLLRHKLPLDLKYLPVVESALDPKAVSRVGATGLWQFMPSTARWFGLEINHQIDERSDPNESTDAALNYLTQLYERFDDWELAIAAYNGGGGRVSRAVKRARSKDFWKVRRYLPRETRNYVPAFIAAYYLLHHYEDHALTPEYPDLDLQLTESTKVHDEFTFYEIAQITGLPLDILEALNPGYAQNRIPASHGGHYLILPRRVMPAFKDFVHSQHPDPNSPRPLLSTPVFVTRPAKERNAEYERSEYVVREGDSMEALAQEFNCTTHQIKAWNNLTTTALRPGQKLVLFQPKNFRRFNPAGELETLTPVASLPPKSISLSSSIWVREHHNFVTKGGFLYYRLPRRERVFELSQRFPEIGILQLMRLNGFKNTLEAREADSYVRIRKL